MRAQATLSEAEEQLAGTAEQLSDKPPTDSPAKRHYASHDAGQYKSSNELAWSDPGPYRGEQLYIPHPHPAHPIKEPEEQAAQGKPHQALANPVPTVTHRRN